MPIAAVERHAAAIYRWSGGNPGQSLVFSPREAETGQPINLLICRDDCWPSPAAIALPGMHHSGDYNYLGTAIWAQSGSI